MRILKHGAGVIVTGRTQRCADSFVVVGVREVTGEKASVATAPTVAETTGSLCGVPVHEPEARSGQGQKHRWVGGDRLVDALAAFEPGSNQVTSIPR